MWVTGYWDKLAVSSHFVILTAAAKLMVSVCFRGLVYPLNLVAVCLLYMH